MPNIAVVRPPYRKYGYWPIFMGGLSAGAATGSGGVLIGGSATVAFGHTATVAADLVVEWDFDNDGDFSESEEDITAYVLALETFTGRDIPSTLNGKATPGLLRATLLNNDDRFSYFNTSSPLNGSPFSLRTGRKIRVRTSTASNPDPALLARDRFSVDGALTTDESGHTWTQPTADDFTVSGGEAVAVNDGQEHLAVVDVAATDYYAQVMLSEVGAKTSGISGNIVGLVYRYQDSNDYSLAVVDVDAALFKLIDVVAGTPSTAASEAVEPYDNMTIGVLLAGSVVTLYHEGTPVLTATAVQTDETEVGIYASWAVGQPAPALDNFNVWASLPAEVEGIIWTGDVSEVEDGGHVADLKTASLAGSGWLSKLAQQTVRPPSTVGGRKTGILVGNTLRMSNQLQPPGPIDEGDITTGPFAMDPVDGLEVARRFEDTEYGFVYEMQEGYIGYDSRTARNSETVAVVFSDDPVTQFGYDTIRPLDWRREIVNRVFAGVAPSAPSGVSVTTGAVSSGTSAAFTMPGTVNAGDLLLVAISTGVTFLTAGRTWQTPPGWTVIFAGNQTQVIATDAPNYVDPFRVYARVADGSEDSVSYTFLTGLTSTEDFAVAHIYRITSWFGTLDGGLTVNELYNSAGPGPLLPPWGSRPELLIAFRMGFTVTGLGSVSGTTYPLGYTDGTSTVQSTAAAIQSARRLVAASVEDPGAFGGTFSGFDVGTLLVGVRGFNGSPPETNDVVIVQADDTDSQDEHNAIRTHRYDANLFANETDADTYADLVLTNQSTDKPVVEISFWANTSAAYRMQAVRRRVSDKITLVADGAAGMGISGDFFIESINHSFGQAGKRWKVTWRLSPAS